MSNAMSRSKSRWKSALLAGAAIAVITPLAAKAQTGLTINLYANPLNAPQYLYGAPTAAGQSPNVYTGKNNVYIDPYDTDTLYVYATVTGSSAPSTSYVDGLNYVYFNVNGAFNGASGLGSITAATPSGLFNGGNNNGSSGNSGAGAQNGSISAITSTSGIVIGSNTSITSIAKPRSASDVFVTSTVNSSSNIVVSGNSVSFLVETLTYTPNHNYTTFCSTPTAVNSVAFNVSIPSVAAISGSSDYPEANYFVGMPGTPAGLASPGAVNTSTGAVSAGTSINLTNALVGDFNLDGTVNNTDLIPADNNVGTTGQTWSGGDLNGDGTVNNTDLIPTDNNVGATLGATPSGLASPTALIGPGGSTSSVPEPTSISLLGFGGIALLRRKRKQTH